MPKVSESKVKDFEDDLLLEFFKIQLEYSMKADAQYLDYLRAKLELSKRMLELKEYDEPWKIFKKRHKKWVDELDSIFEDLCDTYENYGHEFYQQVEFYHKLKGIKKEPND